LERNLVSFQCQTDHDFEHITIPDNQDRGLLWANEQIHKNAHKTNGQFIFVIDDDDHLICSTFIEDLKILLNNFDSKIPNAIICKGIIDEQIFPKVWKEKPTRGEIGSPNFIIDNKTFCNFSHHWGTKRAGDFLFIDAIWNSGAIFYWWNKLIFNTTGNNQ